MKNRILIMCFTLLITASVYGGDNKRGEAGFQFLRVPLGARETAMGTAGITTSTGAGAIFWNPANISASDRSTFSFSHLNYFAGISSNYGAITLPASDVGVFGISMNYFNYGDIEKTTEDNPGGGIGTYAPYEVAFGLSYSKQLTDKVSGGLTLKYITSKIDLVEASGFAFDFGFTYKTDLKGLKIGFVINNLGSQSKYEGDGLTRATNLPNGEAFLKFGAEPFELPASVSFGASMDLFRNEENSITGVVDENINSFQADRTNLGVEYGFKNMFFARAGYTSTFKKDLDYKTGSAGSAGLTFGAGVDYKFNDKVGMAIDYGYLNMGQLGATHRFTVGMKF